MQSSCNVAANFLSNRKSGENMLGASQVPSLDFHHIPVPNCCGPTPHTQILIIWWCGMSVQTNVKLQSAEAAGTGQAGHMRAVLRTLVTS